MTHGKRLDDSQQDGFFAAPEIEQKAQSQAKSDAHRERQQLKVIVSAKEMPDKAVDAV